MEINQKELDAVVVGAGFCGMYMLHILSKNGYVTRAYEAGSSVGGTWYWNRYPGAGCDVSTLYYCYTFSEEIYKEWTWSSKYAGQEEILKYLNFVADKLNLWPNIQFNTRIVSAHFDEEINRWRIQTNDGEVVLAKYFLTALGPMGSKTHLPNIKGLKDFKGELYHTGNWPYEDVDFNGKRVGVIGTGSSGAQAIPIIAEEAEELTVFQRTPQWVFPKNNTSPEHEYVQELKKDVMDLRHQLERSWSGSLVDNTKKKPYPAFNDTVEERQKQYEKLWRSSGLNDPAITQAYDDVLTNDSVNEEVACFIRSKIREIVKDSEIAKKLLPYEPVGARRRVFGEGYYETFNRNNVSLVDLRDSPIVEITPRGLRTKNAEHELDIIVFATGFDAATGGLLKMDIRGRSGLTLKDKWSGLKNFKTNLGVANSKFPNMFTLFGPHSSVTFNCVRGIELHVEWVFKFIEYLENNGFETFETTVEAEDKWTNFIKDTNDQSIRTKVDSWYFGTNVEGKPRNYLLYLGDYPSYKNKFDEVVRKRYEGFIMTPLST